MNIPIQYSEIEERIKPLTQGMFEQYIKDKKQQFNIKNTFSYNKN